MAEATNPSAPETGKPTQINLGDVVNNYLEALQRIHDVIMYTLASERLLNEQEYETFSRTSRVMPSQKSRMDYSAAKSAMNSWLLKQTLNEALGVLVLFLDDCRTISTLSSWKAKAAAGDKAEDIQKKLQEERIAFARLDLVGKINYLKDNHAITSQTEAHIVSMYKLRRALMNRNEIVTDNDVTDGKLTLTLRSVQLKASGAGANQPGVFVTSEVGDIVKAFNVGDKVQLNKNEHIACILTVAFFITSEAQSLKEFAQKLGVTK